MERKRKTHPRRALPFALSQNTRPSLSLPSPDITACEPDSLVRLDADAPRAPPPRPPSLPSPTPDDPRFPEQWNLRAIRVPPAWAATGDTGSPGVRVCIVDTGVDVTHPDLAANIALNAGELAGRLKRASGGGGGGARSPASLLTPDGSDGDANGIPDDVHGASFLNGVASGDVSDANGHGTFVAGVIGAVGNNGLGIAGINQAASLIPCRFMDAGGAGWVSDAIRCWEYCLSRGAHVISNSWGGGEDSGALRGGVSHARRARRDQRGQRCVRHRRHPPLPLHPAGRHHPLRRRLHAGRHAVAQIQLRAGDRGRGGAWGEGAVHRPRRGVPDALGHLHGDPARRRRGTRSTTRRPTARSSRRPS